MSFMNMLTRFSALLVVVAIGFGAVGCAAPQRDSEPVAQTFNTADDVQRDMLWQACQDVLREHLFAIDRLDVRSGVIRTEPQTSQQFFEFWRHDVDTPYDYFEASLRTIRRSVTVNRSLHDDGAESNIVLTVHRETFATPERMFNSSLAAFQMFGEQLPAEATGERITRADDYWIDAGDDSAMARYLLDLIADRYGDTGIATLAELEEQG